MAKGMNRLMTVKDRRTFILLEEIHSSTPAETSHLPSSAELLHHQEAVRRKSGCPRKRSMPNTDGLRLLAKTSIF
ncbi:hypothetical protein BDV40DRAFT_273226 [Aspergillus tamarii]|uniref:Uncharacterized protein n=1 Tax=Aspergillus tamarii TaxID=41984 RepID=A0A5N6ULG3_ASPTM|nr:hypothetical protein BDV40DRAFT_273226 [Aspergillus tamarii]